MTPIGNLPVASVLGIEPRPYDHVPLVTEDPLMWGVWCLAADQERPKLAAIWKSKPRAEQYLRFAKDSMWRCVVCRQSLQAHRPLTASTFAEQRAMDLAAAQAAPAGESATPQGPPPAKPARRGPRAV